MLLIQPYGGLLAPTVLAFLILEIDSRLQTQCARADFAEKLSVEQEKIERRRYTGFTGHSQFFHKTRIRGARDKILPLPF